MTIAGILYMAYLYAAVLSAAVAGVGLHVDMTAYVSSSLMLLLHGRPYLVCFDFCCVLLFVFCVFCVWLPTW